MAIIEDLVPDQMVSRNSAGYEVERSYLVDAVGGTPETRLYNAITTAGVPQYNDPHPVFPDVIVTDVNARPYSGGNPNTIKVNVTYSVPNPDDIDSTDDESSEADSISLSTGLTSEKVYRDINGEFMVVEFKGGTFVRKYASADVQKPQVSVTLKRTETTIPKAAIAEYLGKVNSVPWSGFPAKTWLCTQIDATEDKPGIFTVDYVFSYNPLDWRLEVYQNLTQEQIDELPPDVDSGNGYGIFDVYEKIDFNSLGLAF